MKPACLFVIAIVAASFYASRASAAGESDAVEQEAWTAHPGIGSFMPEYAPIPVPEEVPVNLGVDAMSLERLLAEVESRISSMESALNAWRAALARVPQATALEDPKFSYSIAPRTLDRPRVARGSRRGEIALTPGKIPTLSVSRMDRSGRAFALSSGSPPTFRFSDQDLGQRLDVGQKIEISQMFPWPGKRRLRGEISAREADGAQMDIETVRQKLLHEAKLSYFEYWYVHRALEINAINQELLQQFQDTAESKYAAGQVSKQDALQAEVEREHLRHQEIALTRMRNVAAGRINVLLNRLPETALPPPPSVVPPPGEIPGIDVLYKAALGNRPELHAIQSRIQSKEVGIELTRKEFRPDFSIMATYNSVWVNNEQRFMIGAGVNLPIQIKKRRGAVNEARAEQLELTADLANEAAQIAFQVQEAYETQTENRHVIELYENRLIPAAEENLEAARSGYAAAEVDFLAVIAAQKSLLDTTLKLYEAQASYHEAIADLERAVSRPLNSVSTAGSEEESL